MMETNLLWKIMKLERVMGIEPTSKAWEALVLPLNYTRVLPDEELLPSRNCLISKLST